MTETKNSPEWNSFPELIIAAEHKKVLAKEFNTSWHNVRNALKGYNHSDLACRIRARAKELLIKEAGK